MRTEGRCIALESDDCKVAAGPAERDDAILIGSLLSTRGAQATVNLVRERSVVLAIEEIDAAGGVPSADGARRPLVLVSCDESSDLLRAGRHLVSDLKIRALVGPNTSQDTLDLSTRLTITEGALTISPTAVAATIADLGDDDLTWQLAPTDAQRGPLMVHELNSLEQDLRADRGDDALKLGLILRDDALGNGMRASLETLKFNDKRLAEPGNLGDHVRVSSYDPQLATQHELVRDYLEFAPDILLLVGTAEAVSGILAPLEAGWSEGPHPDAPRPQYLLTDSSKVPELLQLVAAQPELRGRVRGSGVLASSSIADDFRFSYARRYPEQPATSGSGIGASYDATYALAYALALTRTDAASGASIAAALHRLGDGTPIAVGPTQIAEAFSELERDRPIRLNGTFAPLSWDERGAVAGGTIEIWCIDLVDDGPIFVSSGMTAELPAQSMNGKNHVCSARRPGAPTPVSSGSIDRPPQQMEMPAVDPPTPSAAGSASPTPSAAGAPAPPGAGTSAPAPRAGAGGAPAPRAGAPAAPPPVGMPDGGVRDAGSTDAGPPTAPRDARIPCGPKPCVPSLGEYCCTKQVRSPAGSALPEDFSCETKPAACATAMHCDQDSECQRGEVCCLAGSESKCTAADLCVGGHLACAATSDCAVGVVCCWSGISSNEPSGTSCDPYCTPFLNAGPRLCQNDLECSAVSLGLSCQSSAMFPSINVCL